MVYNQPFMQTIHNIVTQYERYFIEWHSFKFILILLSETKGEISSFCVQKLIIPWEIHLRHKLFFGIRDRHKVGKIRYLDDIPHI
jgi:hypothetical protein